jgi:hypothetical protein
MRDSSLSLKQVLAKFARLCVVLLFLISLSLLFSRESLAAQGFRQPLVPQAKGSLPSRLFPDGSVCIVDEEKPNVCAKKLVKVDARAMKALSRTFYGVFDLEADGSPEIFLDYWSPFSKRDGDNVVLLVYKKIRGKYRQYLRLRAQSLGYAPGAWFLNEKPHPKAIFMTRYGGSSGTGLFYLNLNKKSLDLISGRVYLEGQPVFEDLDGDGMAEIFVPGRGRDRTSQTGAAVLHWSGDGYDLWWPSLPSESYVIYAKLIDLDQDGHKQIVAVLDPEDASGDKSDGRMARRELGIWKIQNGSPSLVSKTELPKSEYLGDPHFDWSPLGRRNDINLSYTRTLGCNYVDRKVVCQDEKVLDLRTFESQKNP